jgi:hypothetical protein
MLVLIVTKFTMYHEAINTYGKPIKEILRIDRKPPYIPVRFRQNNWLVKHMTTAVNIGWGQTEKIYLMVMLVLTKLLDLRSVKGTTLRYGRSRKSRTECLLSEM